MLIILTLPAGYYYRTINYIYRFQDKQPAHFIAEYINQRSGPHSIACFGLGTPDCFPLVYATQSKYAERFPSFWWYQGLRQLETHPQQPAVLAQIIKDKHYLIGNFAEDLNRYQPRWVMVDANHFKRIETSSFDIIHYFSENKKFRAAWAHYRYLTTIKSVKLYERVT
jgi:hypothetical protein